MSQPEYSIIKGKDVAKWCMLHLASPATAWLSHWITYIGPEQDIRLYQFDEGVLFAEETGDHLNLHGRIENPAQVLAQFRNQKITCWLSQQLLGLEGFKEQSMMLMKAAALEKTKFEANLPKSGWENEFLVRHPAFADTYRSGLHLAERGGRLHALYNEAGELMHLHVWEEQAELYIGHYVWSQMSGLKMWQEFLKVQSIGKRRVSWVSPSNEASMKLHLASGYNQSDVVIWGYSRD